MNNNNTERAASEDLLSCFLGECERQFRFLEQDYGFRYFSGVAEYKNGRQVVRSYRPGIVKEGDICHLITRYEKDEFALEFRLSTDNYLLECDVYFDLINRLDLEELLQAAKKMPSRQFLGQPVSQAPLLRRAIEDLCRILHENREWLTAPDAKILERALTIRQKMLEHNLREQLKRDMEDACAMAARAFMQKDYLKTVRILTPYEAFLGHADLKKLAFARRQINS